MQLKGFLLEIDQFDEFTEIEFAVSVAIRFSQLYSGNFFRDTQIFTNFFQIHYSTAVLVESWKDLSVSFVQKKS